MAIVARPARLGEPAAFVSVIEYVAEVVGFTCDREEAAV
jgi:hypothetical protein